jgi:hypothetical protein
MRAADSASPSDPSPSQSPVQSSGPSISPAPSSASPSPADSTPSPSGGSGGTGSPSTSPSPSPSPSNPPPAGAVCLTAQIIRHQSHVWPGGTITYSIWLWSTVDASKVTATVTANSDQVNTPVFTLCPDARGTSCTLGSMPADQEFELVIRDHIVSAATPGHQITLTISVDGGGLSPAEAAITTFVGQPNSTVPPSSTTTLPPSTIDNFPTTTITPGSLANLFPTVTPSGSASPGAAGHASHHHHLAELTSSSALPLDSRLIGGQLAGLAVLAAAITMAVARLSLRTPQPAAGPAAATKTDSAITQSPAPDLAPKATEPETNSTDKPPG